MIRAHGIGRMEYNSLEANSTVVVYCVYPLTFRLMSFEWPTRHVRT